MTIGVWQGLDGPSSTSDDGFFFGLHLNQHFYMQHTYVFFDAFAMKGIRLAGVAGFEPAIFGLGGRCIIQLCYTPSVAKTLPMMEVTVAELKQIHAASSRLVCALVTNGEAEHRNRRVLPGPR